MIGCELTGGLGNQFFRYAYARNLQVERGMKDDLLLSIHADYHGQNSDIRDFKLNNHVVIKAKNILLKKGYWWQILTFIAVKYSRSILYRIFNNSRAQKWEYYILGKSGIIASYNPDNENLCIPPNCLKRIFTRGNFENYNYFKSVKTELLNEFTPKHSELERNKNLYNIIRNTNSICLAVRRGDFMVGNNKKIFYVCDLNYYKKAIEYMCSVVENPTFIVFSNDIDWVKQNISIDGNVYYESGEDPVWETYRLMYSCKHFIISNSTLHWWAQEKGSFYGKIVVSPDRWYNAPGWENHLLKDSFVKLATGVKNPYKE